MVEIMTQKVKIHFLCRILSLVGYKDKKIQANWAIELLFLYNSHVLLKVGVHEANVIHSRMVKNPNSM